MSSETPTLGTSVLEDDELLEKAKNASNGRRFTRLYNQGWNSPVVRRVYDKPRHARLALINHLVWWTRHDTGQVRRLFSRSALCPGSLTRYRDYFMNLVRSAVRLLGTACYDPNYAATDSDDGESR